MLEEIVREACADFYINTKTLSGVMVVTTKTSEPKVVFSAEHFPAEPNRFFFNNHDLGVSVDVVTKDPKNHLPGIIQSFIDSVCSEVI